MKLLKYHSFKPDWFLKPSHLASYFSLVLLFSTCKKEINEHELSGSPIQYLSGGTNDKVQKIERTNDGGFIFCGYTITGMANTQGFMLRVDAGGNQLWYRTYGSDNYDLFHHAIQCSDGGFVAVGRTTMHNTGVFNSMDYVVKTDANGNIEWSKSFTEGDLALCELRDVTEDKDHYIYATGNYPSNRVWMAAWILKFDLQGNQIHSKAIECSTNYKPKKFASLFDIGWAGGYDADVNGKGDIILPVLTNLYEPVNEVAPSLLSVTPAGEVNFYYPYRGQRMGSGYFQNGTKSETLKVVCADDGYYLCWNRDSFNSEGAWSSIALQKTDLDGNPLWIQTFKGMGSALVFDVLRQSDGSLIISGSSSVYPINNFFPESFYNSDAMVLKTDAMGNVIFQEYSGIDDNNNFIKCTQDQGTGLLAAGYTCLNSVGYDKMFVIKLDNNGKLNF